MEIDYIVRRYRMNELTLLLSQFFEIPILGDILKELFNLHPFIKWTLISILLFLAFNKILSDYLDVNLLRTLIYPFIKRRMDNTSLPFKKKKAATPSLSPISRNFQLNGGKTSFIICDGTGEQAYDRKAIITKYSDELQELPDDLHKLRADIETRENEKKAQKLKHMYNTYQVALKGYSINKTDIVEDMYVIFDFVKSDYYNFQATIGSMDKLIPGSEQTVRGKYINEIPNLAIPDVRFAHGVGVILTVITSDNKLILTRRRSDISIRPNEIDVSVVEAIDPTDWDKSIDLYKAAKRGAEQELGIRVSEDDVKFLGFGVDLDYYQWNIIGTVQLDKTEEEFIQHISNGIHGTNELDEFLITDASPESIAKILSEEKMWATGIIALYWTAVYQLKSKERFDKILKSTFARK
jgi:hypothetical protein